jgi:hypothetical protein
MDTLRKSIAAFCAVSFIATAVIALFLFNLDRRAFTAKTYQRAFAREDFYNKLPSLMAEAMTASTADQSQFPVVMRGMGREAWDAFFRTLLPPEVLQVMGNDVLNSTFAYLDHQSDFVLLNLAPLKASLTSDAGAQAVLSLLGTLPACDLFQIGQMTLNLFSGGQIELCSPPAELHPMLAPVLQGQLQFTAAAIPDQVVIASAPPQNDPRQRLKTTRAYMRISPILPITFLLGILIFGVRSLKDWLAWWGVPFMAAGGTAFILALLGAPIFGTVLQSILVSQMSAYLPILFLDYAGDLASIMVQTLLSPVMWQGLALAFLGAGMVGVLYIAKLRHEGRI